MKKILLLFFFSIFFLNTKPQTSVYHPFPDSGAVWNVEYVMYCNVSGGYQIEDYSYHFSGDTMIKSQIYHKLYIPYVYIKIDSCAPSNITVGYKGAIRQDTSAKKIFIVFPTDSTELLLYDFNLQIGDSLHGNSEVVSSIDSILIGSNYRKRWKIECDFSSGVYYIIEGIGSILGLIEQIPCLVVDGPGTWLLCFSQNGKALYPDSVSSCNLIDGLNNPLEKNISISPNPASDKITISNYSFSGKEARVEIYNMMGELASPPAPLQRRGVTEVDVSSLAAGIYVVQISDGEKMVRGKMIKQ